MLPSFDLYSIGHSTHRKEEFSRLLSGAGITAIADVRSSPFSRHFPHFSQRELKQWLRQSGVSYVFLGKELGGRPDDPALYAGGVADYEAMAKTENFASGIDRLLDGANRFTVATMCSEHDPLDCHRCLLVARHLANGGMSIGHIMSDGTVKSHDQIEERLLRFEGISADDLFAPRSERLADAYRQRNLKVAYAETSQAASAG